MIAVRLENGHEQEYPARRKVERLCVQRISDMRNYEIEGRPDWAAKALTIRPDGGRSALERSQAEGGGPTFGCLSLNLVLIGGTPCTPRSLRAKRPDPLVPRCAG